LQRFAAYFCSEVSLNNLADIRSANRALMHILCAVDAAGLMAARVKSRIWELAIANAAFFSLLPLQLVNLSIFLFQLLLQVIHLHIWVTFNLRNLLLFDLQLSIERIGQRLHLLLLYRSARHFHIPVVVYAVLTVFTLAGILEVRTRLALEGFLAFHDLQCVCWMLELALLYGAFGPVLAPRIVDCDLFSAERVVKMAVAARAIFALVAVILRMKQTAFVTVFAGGKLRAHHSRV
jgi:hypothetical protein